jgi:flagellin
VADKSLNTMLVEYSLQLLQQDMLTNSLFQGGPVGRSLRDLMFTETQSLKFTDPTAAALSGRLRADAGMLRQASRNVSEAKSIIELAESSAETVNTALTRMKELAQGVADGTMTVSEAQTEYASLAKEIDGTIAAASYNGIKLLDGSQWSSDERVEVSGSSGNIEIQAGTDGFTLALRNLASLKGAFSISQIASASAAGSAVTMLSGHIATVDTIESNYEGRLSVLESHAASLTAQAEIMETAARTRERSNDGRTVEELLLDLLLRNTGTITDEKA